MYSYSVDRNVLLMAQLDGQLKCRRQFVMNLVSKYAWISGVTMLQYPSTNYAWLHEGFYLQQGDTIQFSMRVCNVSGPNIVRSYGIHQVIAFLRAVALLWRTRSLHRQSLLGIFIGNGVSQAAPPDFWIDEIGKRIKWLTNDSVYSMRLTHVSSIDYALATKFALACFEKLNGNCNLRWPFRLMNFWRLSSLMERNECFQYSPVLVICKRSVLFQWISE